MNEKSFQHNAYLANLAPKVANLAPFWEPSWHIWPILERLLRKTVKKQKTLKKIYGFLRFLGGLEGPSGAMWRPCWAMLAYLGDKMGYLKPSWRYVAPSWRQEARQERQEQP